MLYSLRQKWFELTRLVRDSLRGDEYDYTQGSIRRAAVLLAIPMMLEMAMESIFAITDIFFVSQLGADAVATVGLTEAVITILYAIAVGMSLGVTAMVSRRIGEKKPDAAAIVAGQTLWIGLVLSLITGSVGLFFAEDILRFMGASAEVIEQGSSYTTIMLSCSITIIYLFLLNAIFRGAGNAAIAMRSLWLANGINIVLDPCLIFGIGPFPEMGVTGAAIATNIGRGIGVLYQLYYLCKQSDGLYIQPRHLRIVPDVILKLLRVSFGGVFQFFIATASWVILMRFVAGFGSIAIAGYTIAIRIIDMTFLPAWGISNAASTLVGQNLGARKPERAEQSVKLIAKYNFIFLVSVALIFIVFSHELVGIFTDDAEIIAIGGQALRFISYGYGFYAIGMVLSQGFNGAGDTMTPTYISLVCFWLVQIPLAWLLSNPLDFGPGGVFITVTVAESLFAVIAWFIFRTGKWKQTKV